MKKAFLILLFILSLKVNARQNDLIFHSLDSRYGLTYSAVRDIVQDSKGYIWIATLKGLNRYDGYNIQQYYKSENGLPSNCIEKIIPIGNDSLLLATDEGLCIYDMMKETFRLITPTDHSVLNITDMASNENSVFVTAETGLYVYDKFTQLLSPFYKEPLLNVTIDMNGYIWGINAGTIYCFSSTGQVVKKITAHEFSNSYPIEFSAIYKDSQGILWLGTTEDGIYRFNKNRDSFSPVSFAKQDRKKIRYIRCMKEDLHGNLWIGTEDGLFIYNYADNSYSHFREDEMNPQTTLTDNAIYTIFKSKENIMWIGTFFGGVNYTNLKDNNFNYIISDNGRQSLNGKAVSNIIKDKNGALWFASEDKGISILHPDGNIQYLNKSTQPALNGDNVHALVEDEKGYVWAGNFVDGLQLIDLKRNRIESLKNNTGDSLGIASNSIYKLFIHNPDSMIIGTYSGVEVYHFKSGIFTRFNAPGILPVRVDDILKDKQGVLWFSTHYDGILTYNPANKETRHYHKDAPQCKEMVSNNIISSFIDSKNRLWFGTSNGGLMLYDPSSDSFIVYGKENNLIQRDIYAIEEDTFGNLWMSTDNGIYYFNPNSENFTQYNVQNHLISNQFNASSGYKDANGNIYFGSINGVCFFKPENLIVNNSASDMHITFSDFKLFNKHIMPKENGILENNIDNTKEITLEHEMNTLTFDFLVINYSENRQCQFKCEYYLEGIETEWNTAQQLPQSASYNNLAPGKYVFYVRVSDKNNNILEQRQINILIKPHFLLSKFMITIYTIIVLLLTFLIIRFYRIRMRDKMDIKIERMEKNSIQELNKHKLNFFTFITHEFKTPLSILMAVFEDISPEKNIITGDEVKIVKRNIQRLQFLINQLLDFRSVETDHAKIEYVKGDVMEYGRSIFELFIPVFRQKQIVYRCQTEPSSFYTIFDRDKIEKIISNLLSNAFKHSDQNSEINLSIQADTEAKKLIIFCHNSSSYIHPDQREAVMQPFHKTGSSDKKYSNTGVGLALVNGLVQMLSGKIEIESDQQNGTAFKVFLPIVEDVKDMIVPEKKIEITNSPEIIADTFYMLNSSGIDESLITEANRKMTILLVEDNPDINKIIKSKLSSLYKVRTAYHGQEAIEVLKKHIIDIVISDIMMPFMDGYELSKFIKSSREYSHIPVILITSQTSKDSELQGLSAGADAYIQKPFTFDELNLRITNLLKAKSSIREHYHDMKIFELEEKLSNKDETFIQSLTQYVLDNLQDENLNTDTMAAHMNIGRTQLYNKLKKLLNLSVTEFVNKIKIDVAKHKISETDMTFSEISWELGFNNPSYFSKTFKRFAGMTPNEFKKGNTKK